MAKKSYNQKLNDSKNMPYVDVVSPQVAAKFGGDKMLIAPPLAYDAIMRQVPKGYVITTEHMRKYLAKQHGADFTCPLTAGIFVNIAANASEERQGIEPTPYWRTLKKDGELCEKFPGGLLQHKQLLTDEGHQIIQKGKRLFVQDYQEKLYDIDNKED